MKTTIEISDDLLRAAKTLAARDGTTLRALVESGLRHQVESRESASFRLADASFGGSGLQPGIAEGDWESISSFIYGGQGG